MPRRSSGDIDHDGNNEIVAVVEGGYDYTMPLNNYYKTFVVDLAGNIKYQSRSLIDNPFYGTPALADINGDGFLETILAAKYSIYGLNCNGTLVSNYPFRQESTYVSTQLVYDASGNAYLVDIEEPFLFNSSPVIADVDGSGTPDVIIGSPIFGVLGFNARTGKKLDYFPLATTSPISAPPLVADIDGDGEIEIAVG